MLSCASGSLKKNSNVLNAENMISNVCFFPGLLQLQGAMVGEGVKVTVSLKYRATEREGQTGQFALGPLCAGGPH